ncbi:hypothetical protein [Nocardiopsis rhodophaea]|uniref:hypothetical protein n=1 Tax=Nocardiopsis rhodophaea TaxID=280238 RepID=UPI0031DFB24A
MSDTDELGGNPLATRGFILSAVVVGFIVVLAVVVMATSFLTEGEADGRSTRAEASPSPGGETSGEKPQAGSEPDVSICGLGDVQMEGALIEPPSNTEWELVGKMAAPSVDGAGPGRIAKDGFRDCYARTPTGALLAAANLLALQGKPGMGDRVIEDLFAKGPGRDTAIAEAKAGGADGSAEYADINLQISGFRLVSYDGGQANIQVALSAKGVDMAAVMDLVWEEGDWKLRVGDDGRLITPPYELPDMTGFVPWGGA